MASIVTIHGTNVSASSMSDVSGGGHWWQIESYFHQHMTQLISADDGKLNFIPFIWGGKNSESSRHQAGQKLCKLVDQLSGTNEVLCLVGHSHGGSVIADAALQLCSRRGQVAGWSAWITVGTPFVQSTRHFLLFSRLSTPARAAYMILVLCAFASALLPFLVFDSGDLPSDLSQNPNMQFLVRAGISAMLLAPITLGFYVISHFQPKRLRHHNRRVRTRAKSLFQNGWLGLWHEDDEAVHGLKHLHGIKIRPFDYHFAVSSMLYLAIFVLPVFLYVLSLNHAAVEWLIAATSSDYGPINSSARSESPLERFVAVTIVTLTAPARIALPWAEHYFGTQLNLIAVLLFGFGIGILAMWLAALLVYVPFKKASEFLSTMLSRALNLTASKQFNRSALGSDTVGERALYALDQPTWCDIAYKPLPRELADEISQTSNKAAANSIAEIRNSLNEVTFSEKHENVTALVSDYLSWKELVHTTYFHIPRFRKLVAYAICQTPGFSPTNAFKLDPDFALVRSWHNEICTARIPAK
jgi:hypothetical protein